MATKRLIVEIQHNLDNHDPTITDGVGEELEADGVVIDFSFAIPDTSGSPTENTRKLLAEHGHDEHFIADCAQRMHENLMAACAVAECSVAEMLEIFNRNTLPVSLFLDVAVKRFSAEFKERS